MIQCDMNFLPFEVAFQRTHIVFEQGDDIDPLFVVSQGADIGQRELVEFIHQPAELHGLPMQRVESLLRKRSHPILQGFDLAP